MCVGTGFLTHHLAMGVSFEAAIRSVNPTVTLPYWDFTIEGMLYVGKPCWNVLIIYLLL